MAQGDRIDQLIAELAADHEHGSTELARRAITVLSLAGDRPGRMPEVAAALSVARPAMAAMKNAVARMTGHPGALAGRRGAAIASRQTLRWMTQRARAAAAQAASLIPENAVVLTCSYSSAVMAACLQAIQDRRLQVLAVESRVGGTAHGERLAAVLRRKGVGCEIVPDSGMLDAVGVATMVMVGADKVLPGGALVNGAPSLALARAAHRQTPFYAICEDYKLDADDGLEPGFDLVPADLVSGYATEHGLISPADVWAAHGRA